MQIRENLDFFHKRRTLCAAKEFYNMIKDKKSTKKTNVRRHKLQIIPFVNNTRTPCSKKINQEEEKGSREIFFPDYFERLSQTERVLSCVQFCG